MSAGEMLLDGTGGGHRAKVTDENELQIHGTTESHLSEAVKAGRTWNVGTGYLTLTTDNASDVMYVKNNGEDSLHIDLYVVLTKDSTGGAGGRVDVEILRNPKTGTVISDASSVAPINMNFASSKQPVADIYKGGEGKTLAGHDGSLRSKTTDDNRLLLGILTSLPQGASIGIRITPPTGNSSMEVETIIEMYED